MVVKWSVRKKVSSESLSYNLCVEKMRMFKVNELGEAAKIETTETESGAAIERAQKLAHQRLL